MAQAKAKRVPCFSLEQQGLFEKLTAKQQKYVLYRGQGYNKTDSYKLAGFQSKRANFAAYNLEKGNQVIQQLVDVMQNASRIKQLADLNSKLNEDIDIKAKQDITDKALEVIDGADGETAKRIAFYRNIVNGRTKSIRKTTQLNAEGGIIKTTIEEISDIDARIKARKELDKILGLNQIIDMDQFKLGDITVNIVDASYREEKEDERNKVNLDLEKVEVIEEVVEKPEEDVVVIPDKELVHV